MENLHLVGTRVFRLLTLSLVSTALISFGNRTFGQERGVFHSDVDDLLTIEKVSVLPFTDNLQGIYSRPLEAHFISLVQKMHRWDYIPANASGPIMSPDELEGSVEKALKVSESLGANAFFSARVTKGPNGVTMHVSLFLTKDGKLLSQAILRDYGRFDLADLKEQIERLLSELTSRLPYAGRVLSREGNRVTVNLGASDGIQPNQLLSVIQIIQVNRHPKFHFLVKTEKEIFGRVKILKVDETLSFGVVVTEKERGAIQKNSKIGSLDFVTYSGSETLALTPAAEDSLTQREDTGIAFGKEAKAWKPQSAPLFGQIGARLGLGRFSGSTALPGVGGLDANNNLAPQVALDGELWITPEWTVRARMKAGIMPVKNPRLDSEPKELNQSLTYYEALLGYTIRLGPSVSSANLEPFFGLFNYSLFVDSASPEAFTSSRYSGLKFGLRGMAPVGEGDVYGVGGEFSWALSPALTEAPKSSGSSSSSNVVQFGLIGYRKLGERLRAQVHLDFEMYSSTFSGTGTRAESASSASQRFTTLTGGIFYMF
jgi:hypothetical protein